LIVDSEQRLRYNVTASEIRAIGASITNQGEKKMIVICQYTGVELEAASKMKRNHPEVVDKHDLAEWIDEEEAEESGIESDYDWIRGGC
jgi:hypothetical protein